MTEAQYLFLCERYIQGNCSPEEEEELMAYQQAHGLDRPDLLVDQDERVKEAIRSKINETIGLQNIEIRRLVNWRRVAAVAAMIIMVGSFSYYFLKPGKSSLVTNVAKKKSDVGHDILPGSPAAVLTLADGSQIKLDGSKNGVIGTVGSSNISKSGNGIVVSDDQNPATGSTLVNNKISIPRGGKYDIVLPDGTHVWLNASSSLSFPAAFNGKERKVVLTGEAYFEVAKNKNKPFMVDVDGKQTVEVLGTHFNITAFENDKNVKTTLLEGSVKVKYNESNALLIPGQMAINDQGRFNVVKADVDEVMAWKNDMFIFNNENIVSIMKKISRWYDVDVSFKGDMSQINFDGNYSRSKGLNSLLKNIALTDHVRFVIEERRVTVIAK